MAATDTHTLSVVYIYDVMSLNNSRFVNISYPMQLEVKDFIDRSTSYIDLHLNNETEKG